MSRENDSDPLPFMRVDRTAKPKAALLAGVLGVSTQHALGSLIEFWDLCGDPRELEKVLQSTPPGIEPSRVLTKEDAEAKWHLACGRNCAAEMLMTAGLLEKVEAGFRVRGMSRYFEPVEARLALRAAAVAGGKARVKMSVRGPGGRFQPTAIPAGPAAGDRLEDDATHYARISSRSPAGDQPVTSRRPGKRTEDRDQILKEERKAPASADASSLNLFEAPDLASPHPAFKPLPSDCVKDSRLGELKEALEAVFEQSTGAKYKHGAARDTEALKRMLRHEPNVEAIAKRFAAALANKGWPTVKTFAQLDARWNDIPMGPSPSPPKITDRRSCDGCGKPPAPFEVWGHRACVVCHDDVTQLLTGDKPSESLAMIARNWFTTRKRANTA